MACCNDPRIRKEKPFPLILVVIAVAFLAVGGAMMLLGG